MPPSALASDSPICLTKFHTTLTCSVLDQVVHGGSAERPAQLEWLPLVLYLCATQDLEGGSFHQLLGQVHDLVVVCISLRSQGLGADWGHALEGLEVRSHHALCRAGLTVSMVLWSPRMTAGLSGGYKNEERGLLHVASLPATFHSKAVCMR